MVNNMATKPKRNIWKDPSPYGTYEGERGSPQQWAKAFDFAWDKGTAIKIVNDDSPWGILGIPVDSPLSVIKTAFRKLILINHPDKGGDKEVCQKIISAYVILTE